MSAAGYLGMLLIGLGFILGGFGAFFVMVAIEYAKAIR